MTFLHYVLIIYLTLPCVYGFLLPKVTELPSLRITNLCVANENSNRKSRHFYHDFVNTLTTNFPDSSVELPAPLDSSIMYWDNALSRKECDKIIADFEISSADHFGGNVMIDGVSVSDHGIKKNTELHVTEEAHKFMWFSAEKILEAAVTKHLNLYQDANIILATQRNPFGDEGFRMKRYVNDGTEHHAYHADTGGNDIIDGPRRIIAVLIYLNDVALGGETVFYNQGVTVKPVCGRIVMFPTSFSFVHAGRKPVSNSKYVVINFLTS